uniref:Cadherin_C domain-containing protein n=1 Tax=Panagrellus redivivus TaxID=6233 RepID=A0A7E4VZH2_PANRE
MLLFLNPHLAGMQFQKPILSIVDRPGTGDSLHPLVIPFDPLHPQEEHKGYADGPNVHFHRDQPGQRDLEFRRDNEDPADQPIPRVLLSPDEIMKKVQDRREKPINENDKVIDYQSLKKPNGNDNDYKEME